MDEAHWIVKVHIQPVVRFAFEIKEQRLNVCFCCLLCNQQRKVTRFYNRGTSAVCSVGHEDCSKVSTINCMKR